jgi:hypothetical protein
MAYLDSVHMLFTDDTLLEITKLNNEWIMA